MAAHTKTPLLTTRYNLALVTAAGLHDTQVRKGSTIPYLVHALSVSALVLEMGADEDVAIAALLHDTLEDVPDTHPLVSSLQPHATSVRELLRLQFGSAIVALIEACSDDKSLEWEERKAKFIESIPDLSNDVIMIEIADKLHNARSILADIEELGVDVTMAKFKASKEKVIAYYEACAAQMNLWHEDHWTLELERVVKRIAEYCGI